MAAEHSSCLFAKARYAALPRDFIRISIDSRSVWVTEKSSLMGAEFACQRVPERARSVQILSSPAWRISLQVSH